MRGDAHLVAAVGSHQEDFVISRLVAGEGDQVPRRVEGGQAVPGILVVAEVKDILPLVVHGKDIHGVILPVGLEKDCLAVGRGHGVAVVGRVIGDAGLTGSVRVHKVDFRVAVPAAAKKDPPVRGEGGGGVVAFGGKLGLVGAVPVHFVNLQAAAAVGNEDDGVAGTRRGGLPVKQPSGKLVLRGIAEAAGQDGEQQQGEDEGADFMHLKLPEKSRFSGGLFLRYQQL